MSLRILHITPYYLPDVSFGGPVFSVSALCEALQASGNQITVFTVAYGPQAATTPRTENVNGVEVRYFKGEYGSPCQVSTQLWKALEQDCRNFDVVHLHTWWNILIFRSLQILKRRGVPAIVSPRGMLSDYSFTHRKTLLKRGFQTSLGVSLLRGTSLHATSDAEAADMALRSKQSIDDIFVMPNLLNLQVEDHFVPGPGGITLGFLSRLHHKKGIEVLLQAMPHLPEVTELVIGGRGDAAYEAQLHQMIDQLGIGSRVRFAGWISDAQKPEFFRQFQLFVLPSFNENFANVVAEAWAAGKPVIVSSEVGLSDYVEKFELGWVCQPEVDSLVQSVKQAIAGSQHWPDMGQAAIDLVNERFSDARIVAEYNNMYQRVVQPGKRDHLAAPKADAHYILGINAHHADASAALLRNGEVLVAIEEERLRRVKHWAGFPSMAIDFCLREAGIGLQDVDAIAIGRDPKAKWLKKAQFMMQHPAAMGFLMRGRLNNAEATRSFEERLNKFARTYGIDSVQDKLHFVEHHRSHLASAFYASGMQQAALLSVDGSGDFTTTMMGIGRGNNIEVLDSIDFPHSLGIFYTAFTQLLGFPHYGDEYKVMGLAPYGQPVYFEQLKQVVKWTADGQFELEPEWFRPPEKGYITYDRLHRPVVPQLFSEKMEAEFGKVRQADEPLTEHHKNMAASVQKMLEETVFHILVALKKRTGENNLCLAGGVAQNSVTNGKITRRTGFEQVYVPAAGHDAGLAIGAAMYVYHQVLQKPRNHGMKHAYTGSRFTEHQIQNLLEQKGVAYRRYPDEELFALVAEQIAHGGVIGWFRGRSEFGPRALGNRSILADPRRSDAKDLLNRKIKRRESFRPFAPSVLADHAGEWFDYFEEAPFMEKVFQIKKEKQDQIPAVTHVDGSGRIQTVCRENNMPYYELIDNFRRLTGVPILLNTSFNENEPIVDSPEEALACFERTSMDMLVLENFVITRQPEQL